MAEDMEAEVMAGAEVTEVMEAEVEAGVVEMVALRRVPNTKENL